MPIDFPVGMKMWYQSLCLLRALSFLYLLLQITNSSEDQAGAEVVTAVVEVVRVMVTVIEGVDITTEEDTGVVTGVETGVETDMTLHLVTVMVVALIGAAEDVVDLEAVVVSCVCTNLDHIHQNTA